jgi:chromate transporter
MEYVIQLVTSFMLIGLGAYGGGLVTIPLIQHEIVAVRHWLAFEEIARLLAIAQMTPGPIAVNAATFVGFRILGLAGALAATVAVILPSISILVVLAPVVDKISTNSHVRKIRHGLQIGVLSLILFATLSYGSAVITGWTDLALAVSAFGVLVVLEGKMHPVFVILGCGVLGLILF